jgi:hypothetical protein
MSTETEEQPSGIPVEIVIRRLDEKKSYQLRLEFIPKEGDTIEVGEVAHKVTEVKYKEVDGAFIPVISLEAK